MAAHSCRALGVRGYVRRDGMTQPTFCAKEACLSRARRRQPLRSRLMGRKSSSVLGASSIAPQQQVLFFQSKSISFSLGVEVVRETSRLVLITDPRLQSSEDS